MDSTGREYDDWGDDEMSMTVTAIWAASRYLYTGIIEKAPEGVHPDRWVAMINSIVLNGGVV